MKAKLIENGNKIYVMTRIRTRSQDEWVYGYFVNIEKAKNRCDFHRKYDDKYHHTEVREYDATCKETANLVEITTDDTNETYFIDYSNYAIVYGLDS